MDTLTLSQAQMKPRIARFKDMEAAADVAGQTGRMPPELKQAVIPQTVYGLTSPTGGDERNFWDSAAVPAGTPNFGAVYVRCKTGEGPGWHVHRYSYENFIAMRGRWRVFWNGPEAEEHVDLDPMDMVSIPPGAIRRFTNIGEDDGVLLAFAYAAEHSLVDSREIWLPPCEIERIENAVPGAEGPAKEVIETFRRNSAATAAAETPADRAFRDEVAKLVGAA